MAKTKHHTTKLWIYSVTLWISSILAKGNNCLRGSCRSDCGGYSINSSFSAALHTLLQDYDNALRPTHYQGKTTDVICDVYINSFDSISVDTMDFSVNIYMRETWKDSRLAYQHLFPNLTRITLDHRVFDRIWVPDLFFPNEKAASTHCVTVPNAMIRIQPNGSIMYSSRYTLTLSCHMRLRRYPFDKQECFMRIESSSRGGFFVPNKTLLQCMRYSLRLACHMNLRRFPLDKQICHMRIESYSYTLEEMKLRWSNDSDPVQTNEDLTLPQFELLDVKTHHCHKSYITDSYTVDEMLLRWKRFIPVQINDELELPQFILVAIATTQCSQSYVTGDFACLEIRFTLQRQYGYFMIQTYVPSILIVTLSWVAFWINIDAVPARISLGVLTVLTLTTQCVGVWMSLPRVSYVKAIDVWMSFCIIAVFAAMLEFALVNTLARKEIRRLSMRVRKTEKIENNSDLPSDMIKRMMDEYTYGVPQKYDPNSRMLARKVDKVSRWLFPFVFIVFNVAYWCIYLIE